MGKASKEINTNKEDYKLSKDEIAYTILWELCSGYWQAVLRDSDESEWGMAERVMEIMEMDNKQSQGDGTLTE